MSHAKKKINLTNVEIQDLIVTLTPDRLTKYSAASKNDIRIALELYTVNTKITSSLITDVHYLEVALRNAFDKQLSNMFKVPATSTTPEVDWFNNPVFLDIICPVHPAGHPKAGWPIDSSNKGRKIIKEAIKNASKKLTPGTPPAHGKVIAELHFGFWHRLVNKDCEHPLWIPCLRHAFPSSTVRSVVHNDLETIRLLRNRIAHHEPLIYSPIEVKHQTIVELISKICPITTRYMLGTSTFKQEMSAYKTLVRRKKL